jgi:HAD superfamily hydrolase (TIGR01450 family)
MTECSTVSAQARTPVVAYPLPAPERVPGRPERPFSAYLFDLDGTVYLGDRLIDGAEQTILGLREAGIPVRFLSNNPTKSPVEYARKLTALGLPTPVEEITNTVVSTTRWLRANAAGAAVYPIAEQPVVEALEQAGVRLSDDPDVIDIVLASYDRTFTYAKLQIAFDALWGSDRPVRLMSTNPDRYCPFPGGRGQPDAAGIVAAIEATTGVHCERTFGKPEAQIAHMALEGVDVEPADCMMVGDRLGTDIGVAHAAGLASTLVLTGDSTADEVLRVPPHLRPTYLAPGIGDLLPARVG